MIVKESSIFKYQNVIEYIFYPLYFRSFCAGCRQLAFYVRPSLRGPAASCVPKRDAETGGSDVIGPGDVPVSGV